MLRNNMILMNYGIQTILDFYLKKLYLENKKIMNLKKEIKNNLSDALNIYMNNIKESDASKHTGLLILKQHIGYAEDTLKNQTLHNTSNDLLNYLNLMLDKFFNKNIYNVFDDNYSSTINTGVHKYAFLIIFNQLKLIKNYLKPIALNEFEVYEIIFDAKMNPKPIRFIYLSNDTWTIE